MPLWYLLLISNRLLFPWLTYMGTIRCLRWPGGFWWGNNSKTMRYSLWRPNILCLGHLLLLSGSTLGVFRCSLLVLRNCPLLLLSTRHNPSTPLISVAMLVWLCFLGVTCWLEATTGEFGVGRQFNLEFLPVGFVSWNDSLLILVISEPAGAIWCYKRCCGCLIAGTHLIFPRILRPGPLFLQFRQPNPPLSFNGLQSDHGGWLNGGLWCLSRPRTLTGTGIPLFLETHSPGNIISELWRQINTQSCSIFTFYINGLGVQNEARLLLC